MRLYEYGGSGDDGGYRVLELPARGAAYDPREIAFMGSGLCQGTDPATGRPYDPRIWDTNTNKGTSTGRGTVTVDGASRPKYEVIERARMLCIQCPVLHECYAFIMAHPEDEGIWAGLLPEERKELA